MDGMARQIAELRKFNRFYTRYLGALNKGFLHSDFTLGECRVIYELAQSSGLSARDLADRLDMDAGQLSRMLKSFARKHVVVMSPDPDDRRAHQLFLTDKGKSIAQTLEQKSNTSMQHMLEPLSPFARDVIVSSADQIRQLLSQDIVAPPEYRSHRIGELGWLVHRQAILYADQFGWNSEFEALIAQLYGEFEMHADTTRKKLWIAEWQNEIVGSVYVLPSMDDKQIAQLRMLYVEPVARGQGIGSALVDRAVKFAMEMRYKSIMLWTQDCLTSARRIYINAGFQLERENPHHSFGVDLNGQYWTQTF